MKTRKFLFTALVVLSMLALTAGAALAAPAAGVALSLIDVRNDSHGGVIFVFSVSGNFSNSELNNGYVQVEGGDHYGLHCNQVDEGTVQCASSKKAGGHNVAVNFGGSTFWAFVPEARVKQYCYSVWSAYYFDPESSTLVPLPDWSDFGPHCQDEAARLGDFIIQDLPDGDLVPALFYDVDVSDYCPDGVPYDGPAYYLPSCPI